MTKDDQCVLGQGMMMRSRRSQLEIFGLVVLVIIIVVAFLIFTVYKLNSPQKDTKGVYVDKQLSSNVLLALSKTNVAYDDCYSHTISQLITDCAKTYHSFSCFGRSSCDVAEEVIGDILSETLYAEGINYNLTIHGTNISFVDGCTPYANQVEGFIILPMYPGEVEVTLSICE